MNNCFICASPKDSKLKYCSRKCANASRKSSNNTNKTRICVYCKKEKDFWEFRRDTSKKVAINCNSCFENRQLKSERTKKFAKDNGYCLASVYRVKDERSFIRTRLQEAKKRAKFLDREFSITEEYLYDLFKKQSGLCSYTNIQMTWVLGDERRYNISIDRINSDIGYIEGNVQLVCSIINMIKNDLSSDDFVAICMAVAKNRKQNG